MRSTYTSDSTTVGYWSTTVGITTFDNQCKANDLVESVRAIRSIS